jgi:hypothetical protein
MPIFEIGQSQVGSEDTLGGTASLVEPPVDPPPDPEPPTEFTIPTTPADFAFLDAYAPPLVDYTFVVGGNSPGFVLANIQGPGLTFNLKDACDVSFSLNQLDPIATRITEMLTDLWVYRDGDFIFRGRVGPSQDSLSASGGSVSFTSLDYRARAKRWFIYDDDLYFWFDEDVSVIAGDLLDIVQGRTGANYGVTRGIGFPTLGVIRSEVEFTPGSSFADGLDSLQESKVRGFDWEISPELELNIWAQRGITPGDVEKLPLALWDPATIRRAMTEGKTAGRPTLAWELGAWAQGLFGNDRDAAIDAALSMPRCSMLGGSDFLPSLSTVASLRASSARRWRARTTRRSASVMCLAAARLLSEPRRASRSFV